MNLEEYEKNVTVLMVPHLEGPVTPETYFHVITYGLHKHYGLPELEVVSVPAAYVEDAGALLNRWATYQIEMGKRIRAGERASNSGSMLVYRFEPSKNPPKRGPCLEIILDHVHFQCGHCHGRGGAEA